MTIAILKQPASLGEMSQGYRWFVLLCGLVETCLWSGTIFGWASLVHIMKTQGVFSHFCLEGSVTGWNGSVAVKLSGNATHVDTSTYSFEVTRGCPAQDEHFTLIGTVAMVLYSCPGILIGYGLHHLGQAFTRITASILSSVGFVLLSLTSKETPNFLWGGAVLVSIGGNMLRVACFEFGNLFPERRNTVMAVISGIYTISAGLFMLMQYAFEAGYRWELICQLMAIGSSLVILTTLFIPRHHVPHEDEVQVDSNNQYECQNKQATECAETDMKERKKPSSASESQHLPFSESVLSVSMGLLEFWVFANMFSVTIFGTYFNSWINRFSKSNDEAAHYSKLFGYANVFCVFTSPLPGLIIDLLAQCSRRGKTGIEAKVATVQSMVAPMIFISITVTTQISCFFFFSPWAVYLGLFCLMINRPGCLGVGIPFMRSRFPADHFNRLIGIQGTVISLLSMLQYPHFTWTQSDYFTAIGVLVGLLALSVVQPLHLFNKKHLRRVMDTSKAEKKEEA